MPRVAKDMEPVEIKRLTRPGFHAVGHFPGLLLQVRPTGSRYWVYRTHVGGKRKNIGIGPYPAWTVSEAAEEAKRLFQLKKSGIDPVAERKRAQQELRAQQRKQITFREAWRQFWADKSGELGDKTARHWQNSVESYAMPHIGSLYVAQIDEAHIEALLREIWFDKTVTAKKLRQRLESVFSWATVKKYREGPNPARWKDNLKELLPKPSKVYKAQNFRALPIDDVPEFMAELQNRQGSAARALEFAILTAARSGEVRFATWKEFDLERKVWRIPAERMKMEREHIVPLSDAAVRIIKSMPKAGEPVFVAPRGSNLSDMSLLSVVKRMGYHERTTVHGFRSCFKSWASERTDHPDHVSELALAHDVGDDVMKAYQRSTLESKRRHLMRDWSRFIGYTESAAKVVNL